mmetsp:Transcript_16286/g.24551  ORF Transcript_16286/g.24551 Transcript_16286/m.24551 type:complete len:523 (-) Transcript_16286:24-1592(-)|eukprot:CAMPEP_0167761100 /NCGR_PEP_ID=MMETSP0110_2-20121227/11972_1 /TAXON_ID=629695 /ORGANISM="Gymnochlora sp., Strain CCMP2014" /LENGTH=522 /DNA_ID=CAMNT_0007647721 /DNA_START=68 /DNA_END=1636 /DNA_ORIENTATION=-
MFGRIGARLQKAKTFRFRQHQKIPLMVRWHMGHSHGHGSGGHGHSHGSLDLEDLPEDMGKKAQRITWIGMAANAGLCVSKAGIGFSSGSASLVADAAHSISDMVSDVVALVAVKIGRKPADAKQPYGYGHYETLGTLTVASLLVGAGIGSAIHGLDHLRPLLDGSPMEPVSMVSAALACAFISVGVKEWLYQVTVRVGKETRSQVLIANAWHHRTDAFSSIVAILGIGGSAIGFPFVDPIGAILVAGMIMKAGVEIGWEAVHNLVDAQTNSIVVEKINEIGKDFADKGVIRRLSKVRCRRLGHYVLVDLVVQVDPYSSVTAASQAGRSIEREIKTQLPEVAEVVVQLTSENEEEIVVNDVNSIGQDPSNVDKSEEVESPSQATNKRSISTKITEESILSRTQPEIEADIRKVVSDICEKSSNAIVGLSHISLHYVEHEDRKGQSVIAELSLVMEPHLTITAARINALMVRDEILKQVKDVHEVDLHMELLHGLLDCDNILQDRHYKFHSGITLPNATDDKTV